jgi:hypothetical protein
VFGRLKRSLHGWETRPRPIISPNASACFGLTTSLILRHERHFLLPKILHHSGIFSPNSGLRSAQHVAGYQRTGRRAMGEGRKSGWGRKMIRPIFTFFSFTVHHAFKRPR